MLFNSNPCKSLVAQAFALSDPSVRKRIPLFVFLSLLLALLEAAGLGLVVPLISFLNDPSGVNKFPLLRAFLPSSGADNRMAIAVLACMVGLAFFSKNLGIILLTKWQLNFVMLAEGQLAVQLFRHYLRMPSAQVVGRNTNELIRNVYTSSSQVYTSFIVPLLNLVVEVLVIIAVLVMVLSINPVASSVVLGLVTLCGGVLYGWTRKRMEGIGRSLQANTLAVLNELRHGFGSLKELEILGRREYFVRRFAARRFGLADDRAAQAYIVAVPRQVLEMVLLVALVGLLGVSMLTGATEAAFSMTSLFAITGLRLLPSITRLLNSLQVMKVGKPAVETLYRDFLPALSAAGPIEDRPAALDHVAHAASAAGQGIELRDVTVVFDGSSVPALKNLNLTIPWGTTIGLVGPSGAGKTTLAEVIMGIIKPQSGQCLADGVPIDSLGRAWMDRIGYVPQNVFLIDDTILRNIAFGIEPHLVDAERVQRVATTAQLDEFLGQQKAGLDARVGEGGNMLSGGQRQRIGLARALYNADDVLVLDEATSALDNHLEHQVTRTLKGLRGNVTSIVIAHRLSTVLDCDRIVFLEEGSVVASGTFQELMDGCASFRQMVQWGGLANGPAQGDPSP